MHKGIAHNPRAFRKGEHGGQFDCLWSDTKLNPFVLISAIVISEGCVNKLFRNKDPAKKQPENLPRPIKAPNVSPIPSAETKAP